MLLIITWIQSLRRFEMSKLEIPVKFTEIEKGIEGKPLSNSEIQVFEKSYRNYIKDINSDQERMEETLEEMANLLTINQKNLEEVTSQSWFKRSWKTITGHNKNLEKINQGNLLKVQKGALYFLQNSAERNQATFEAVTFAIKRVDDLQIESAKLKGYLFQIIQKYNSRIKQIENKLDEHNEAIEQLKKEYSSVPFYFIAALFLIISIILFVLTESFYTKWVLSGILLIFSLILIISKVFKRSVSHLNTQMQNTEPFEDEITVLKKENLSLRILINNECQKFIEKFIDEDFAYSPFAEFGESYSEIEKTIEPISSDSTLDKNQITGIIYKTISIEICSFDRIRTLIHQNITEFVEAYSNFVVEIVKNYLPNSIGVEAFVNIDIQTQIHYELELNNAISPYHENLKSLISQRYDLLSRFSSFEELFTESNLKSFGKGFLEGLTFGLVGNVEGEEKFVNEYIDSFVNYGSKIEDIVQIFTSSILPLHTRIYSEFANNCIDKLNILWDEFNDQKVHLKPLLDALYDANKEQ